MSQFTRHFLLMAAVVAGLPAAGRAQDPVGLFAAPTVVDSSAGWYLPSFGYLPPWPHTLPRDRTSERYMGYLVPSKGGYWTPRTAADMKWMAVPQYQWYWTPKHLESPFLDAIDAHKLRWTYPPNYRPARVPGGQQGAQPVIVPPVPTQAVPAPFPALQMETLPPAVELSRVDAATLRAEAARLLKADQPARAFPLLTAATARDADDAAAWALLAVAEHAAGRPEEAAAAARRSRALELAGRADAAAIAKALEPVQGPARRFLKDAGDAVTLADAQALLARPAVTGLAAK